MWTQQEAIELCKKIESFCPKFGCHVALTGGLLYREGQRKDLDILFYRIRQVSHIDFDGLSGAMAEIGLLEVSGFGWCVKFVCQKTHRKIDVFFPEELEGEYNPDSREMEQAKEQKA